MTKEKQKAIELRDKFEFKVRNLDGDISLTRDEAKQCAIIFADEIIDQWEYIDTYLANLNGKLNINLMFWQEVKKELENL